MRNINILKNTDALKILIKGKLYMEFKVGEKYIMRGNLGLPKPDPVTIVHIDTHMMLGTIPDIALRFIWNLDGTYPGDSGSDLIAKYSGKSIEAGYSMPMKLNLTDLKKEIKPNIVFIDEAADSYKTIYDKPMSSYVKPHTCVAVDTGFRKTWCRICDKDM